jgi:hypothetical protein
LRALDADFNRHLVGGTTDATRAYFDRRRNVFKSGVEQLQRIRFRALLDGLERAIHDVFGGRLLAVIHQAVHELRDDEIAILGVRENFAFLRTTTT